MTSFTITTETEVNLGVDSVTCQSCGADLDYTADIDGWNDISLVIHPCTCVIPEEEEEVEAVPQYKSQGII